jgi:phosphoglycerate dehydrogenase-like enzyme
VNEAQHLLEIFEQEQRDKELEKVTTRQLRESNKLLRDKLDAARKQRAATKREEKAERDRLKAEEAALRSLKKVANCLIRLRSKLHESLSQKYQGLVVVVVAGVGWWLMSVPQPPHQRRYLLAALSNLRTN